MIPLNGFLIKGEHCDRFLIAKDSVQSSSVLNSSKQQNLESLVKLSHTNVAFSKDEQKYYEDDPLDNSNNVIKLKRPTDMKKVDISKFATSELGVINDSLPPNESGAFSPDVLNHTPTLSWHNVKSNQTTPSANSDVINTPDNFRTSQSWETSSISWAHSSSNALSRNSLTPSSTFNSTSVPSVTLAQQYTPIASPWNSTTMSLTENWNGTTVSNTVCSGLSMPSTVVWSDSLMPSSVASAAVESWSKEFFASSSYAQTKAQNPDFTNSLVSYTHFTKYLFYIHINIHVLYLGIFVEGKS